MLGSQGEVIQYKRLWQLVSGIHFDTPIQTVKDQLESVSNQLLDGLKQFKKSSPDSEQKLKGLLKKSSSEKLLPFTQKLQQYLDLDAEQSWELLCYYLMKEYKGSASSLSNYISTESAMLKLLNDIWAYYSLERTVLLNIVKTLLAFHDSSVHPYAKQYKNILEKINIKKLLKSYIEQFETLVKESNTGRNFTLDYFNNSAKLIASNERQVREQVLVLQIIILCIDCVGVEVDDLNRLIDVFKGHAFGKQQQYLSASNPYHAELVSKVSQHEVAVILRAFDVSDSHTEEEIQKIIDSLQSKVVACHQYAEHGPLLLVWMLTNFRIKETVNDEDLVKKIRQFGNRAVQLKVFEFLVKLCQHQTFQDHDSRLAQIVRKSIYNHLSHMCELFDAEESLGRHANVYELLSELLKTPVLAKQFCKDETSPIRALLNVVTENFPINFHHISQISSSLAQATPQTSKYIRSFLEQLPVYTESYLPDKYILRPSNDPDTYILVTSYRPFRGIDFQIPADTEIEVVEKSSGQTFCYFKFPINYFTALHHEVNELLAETLMYNQIQPERETRVTSGLELLAKIIKRTNHAQDINEQMVHPTEMVFDILMKFRSVQQAPIHLLASCLKVCTALVPLFDEEIIPRVINLNILPSVKSITLDFKNYAVGSGFESGLVGSYLVNFEKNSGRYEFLKAYLEFLAECKKTQKDLIYGIDLPGLIFLLCDVLPHIYAWTFETDKDRQDITISILEYIIQALQPSTNPKQQILRHICIYNLMHLGNGMTLLRFVAVGNAQLEYIMENESNWIAASTTGVNYLIQLSLTILMQILKDKNEIKGDKLSALESMIYTQPKQVDTLRIINVVTGYMNNIFNSRLPVLACRLLRRFALEFQMSLLACLDMEPDQIRMIFLSRLSDPLENENMKVAVLELVDSCIEKQPGLTEAFFKISYEQEKRFLEKIKASKKRIETDGKGILEYMQEFLDVIVKEPEKIASPLLSRIMSLFHTLWKHNMQSLVKDLLKKKTFWGAICAPIFADGIQAEIRAYSQLFNILGIEVFRVAVGGKLDADLKEILEKILQEQHIKKWLEHVFALPMESEVLLDDTPEWLCRLQSFKDFLVLIVKCKSSVLFIPEETKKFLADTCLRTLVERTENFSDIRPLVILAELYLVLLKNFKQKYTSDEKEDLLMLNQMQALLSFLSSFYKDIPARTKDSLLAISIKMISLFSDCLEHETSICCSLFQSSLEIISFEIFALEAQIRTAANQAETCSRSIQLSIALLKNILLILDKVPPNSWTWTFTYSKIYNQTLSCVAAICKMHSKRKITVDLLDLLTVFATGECSKELLFSDMGDYLWLKLLPPDELLKKSYERGNKLQTWQMQDWWPIYIKGIQLVTKMLEQHGHNFKKEAIFFTGIHEEFLMDSLLLIKQSLEPNAIDLIKAALELILELCLYEDYWRLEHPQSLANLMRCIQILMDTAISLLYRPKILKRLVEGESTMEDVLEILEATDSTDQIVGVMNELIEIISICSKCLLSFSPPLLKLLCDVEFLPSQYFALIDIQFGAPKLTSDTSLSFGSVMSAAYLLTKSLNLQHYEFQELPLNQLPNESDEDEATAENLSLLRSSRSLTPQSQSTTPSSPKTPFRKSLSTTSVTSFTGHAGIVPSNELLSHLSVKACLRALELTLTLLASQSMLALKSVQLSSREKQLIRRELSNELLLFHDFVRKKITRDLKSNLHRKKYGIVYMTEGICEAEDEKYDEQEIQLKSMQTPPIVKRTGFSKSLRIQAAQNIMKKHATEKPFDTSIGLSPIQKPTKLGTLRGPTKESTPMKSILKPTTSTSHKGHVMFDDSNRSPDTAKDQTEEDIPMYFDADEPNYIGLSYVKTVEEDYFQFLSNLFLVVCQSEN